MKAKTRATRKKKSDTSKTQMNDITVLRKWNKK